MFKQLHSVRKVYVQPVETISSVSISSKSTQSIIYHHQANNGQDVPLSDVNDENLNAPTNLENCKKPQNYHSVDSRYKPGALVVWALCITSVMGGFFFDWNLSLTSGFASYLIGKVIMGLSFIIFACSLSEIVSTTTFSGGSYGMARVVLGFYAGYMVAGFELLQYLFNSAASLHYIAHFLCDSSGLHQPEYQIIVSLLCLIPLVLVLLEGNYALWGSMILIAVGLVILILIYCFGTLQFANIEAASLGRNESNLSSMDNWFAGGIVLFLQILPSTSFTFAGLEASALVTDIVSNPRRDVPYGMVSAAITLFVLIIFMVIVACSVSNGLKEFIGESYLMDIGFMKMGISRSVSHGFMIVAHFATLFGFMLPCAKLFLAMNQSNLLPRELFQFSRIFYSQNNTPSTEISLKECKIWIAVFLFFIDIFAIYVPSFDLFMASILLGLFNYLNSLYAFYRLRTDLVTTAEKTFESPFGLIGAGFASLVFGLSIISILFFQRDAVVIGFVIGFGVLMTIHYFSFTKKHQQFSEQEQKTLLSFHVIQNNRVRRQQNTRKRHSNQIQSKAFHSFLKTFQEILQFRK